VIRITGHGVIAEKLRVCSKLVKFFRAPCRKNYALDRKMDVTFFDGHDELYTMQNLEKIAECAPAVGAKMWCFLLPAGLPRSGKLPVLFLLTGQKSGFSPRRGDSLHRFRSNFAGPTGTWVRLAVQNFTSIGAEGWECGPQKCQTFSFFGKESPRRGLTDFQNV